MKKYSYLLDKTSIDLFFPHNRIKNKIQILEIILEATRFILFNEPTEPQKSDSKLILNINKMSRLFFFNEKKYYSLIFPFTFIIDQGTINITYKNLISIDSKTISQLLSIIKDEKFNSSYCLDFIEPISEIENDYDNNLWDLLRDLMMVEDGYLRFDNDILGFSKAKEKNEEHVHPENHLDVFYTNNNTFKIGLISLIDNDQFIDYLDIRTDCKYLKNFR